MQNFITSTIPHVCKSECLQLVLLLKGFSILIPSLDPPSVRVCCLSTHPTVEHPNSVEPPTQYVSLQHCEEVLPQLSGTPTHASDPSYASHCPPSPLIHASLSHPKTQPNLLSTNCLFLSGHICTPRYIFYFLLDLIYACTLKYIFQHSDSLVSFVPNVLLSPKPTSHLIF